MEERSRPLIRKEIRVLMNSKIKTDKIEKKKYSSRGHLFTARGHLFTDEMAPSLTIEKFWSSMLRDKSETPPRRTAGSKREVTHAQRSPIVATS